MLIEKYAAQIERILAKYPDKRSAVMPLLYISQEEYGQITDQGIREVAEIIGEDPTSVKSVAGFYTMYAKHPKGKYWLQVCTDLACALRGADQFHEDLKAYLGIKEEGGTSADGLFTVEHVMCLAACDKAPVLQCNFHFVENLDMDKMKQHIEQWRAEAASPAPKAAKKKA
ncbi:MAG TPA: NADH-quinone oxidoreductase subunit NuoE [Candidatus Limnocylindrales bacterium]|nr:NADH-quinone oxidoreductase subunit NuoE [Candidatus Limnocylindrales bacterium]